MKRVLSNKEIKLIRSLSQKKYRKEYGLFVVEGEKMLEEARKSNFQIVDIFSLTDIGEASMKKISSYTTVPPCLAVIKSKDIDNKSISKLKEELISPKHKLSNYLVLDNISDPGNLGTIIRLADWFGVQAIICSENTVDIYNSKTIQASMGSVFRVDVYYTNLHSLFTDIADKCELIGTVLDGESLYESKYSSDKSRIIVIGNESKGISSALKSLINKFVTIPKSPDSQCESLNAAIATSIVLSELSR